MCECPKAVPKDPQYEENLPHHPLCARVGVHGTLRSRVAASVEGRLFRCARRVLEGWAEVADGAGAFFGGTAKRHLPSRTDGGLEAFRRETIRAERVHWLILASTPAHLIWCRPTVFLGMVAYGVVFNVPFIVVQRANRGRLDRILSRRRRR